MTRTRSLGRGLGRGRPMPEAAPVIRAACSAKSYRWFCSSGRSRRSHSFRQLLAGLLADHVLGVPFWPVRVGLPRPRLVLSVGGRGAPKRARQIVRRREGRRRGVNATGQPRRDLLEQPAVAVRITERGERAVAAMLGIRTGDPEPPKQVGLVRAGVHAAGVVENLADLDAASEQLVAGGGDVGDYQVQALGGAGCCGGDILAEDNRASGTRRRELDHAEVVTVVIVGVEPPPEPPVELLRAVDIRDGDDDHLELCFDSCDAGRFATTEFVRAYGCLLGCGE